MTTLQTKPNIPRRFFAGLIDYTLVIGLFYAFLFSFGVPESDGEYTIKGFITLVPIALWFLILILPEVVLGATIGNLIVGLKPKSLTKNTGELSVGQSIGRHLFDVLDMVPLIGIVTIKNTARNQRLGNLWAETIVVENNQK